MLIKKIFVLDKKTSSQTSTAAGLTTAQKDALLKQREGYQTKLEILEREIAKLQNKEDELVRSRADPKLVDENLKLQVICRRIVTTLYLD